MIEKMFELTMVVSASIDLTELDMMRRFEEFLEAIPKNTNRIIFQSDCCLVSTKVSEIEHANPISNPSPLR